MAYVVSSSGSVELLNCKYCVMALIKKARSQEVVATTAVKSVTPEVTRQSEIARKRARTLAK